MTALLPPWFRCSFSTRLFRLSIRLFSPWGRRINHSTLIELAIRVYHYSLITDNISDPSANKQQGVFKTYFPRILGNLMDSYEGTMPVAIGCPATHTPPSVGSNRSESFECRSGRLRG